MSVNIRFEPRPGPAPAPPAPAAPKNYTLMEVNGVTYLITDMVGGKPQAHTEDVWKAKAADMKKLFAQLQADNDGEFSPEFISHVQVDIKQNRVTYNKRTDQLATPTVAKLKNPQTLKSFTPFSDPGLIHTYEGSFSQSTSPYAQNNPAAKSACSYIVAEMAEIAIKQHYDEGNNLVEVLTPNIDYIVEQGQAKYMRNLPRIKEALGGAPAHVSAAEIQMEYDFPHLKQPDMRTPDLDIPETQTAEFYAAQLEALGEDQIVSAAALTNRAETIGVIIHRNAQMEITEVLYFDSHANCKNDANYKACIKRFATAEAAGAFLAHRIPHEPISPDTPNPDWNKLSITPLVHN